MAIRKVCGIETEYGISVRGADSNPVAASSVLINAYIGHAAIAGSVWDFEDETPGHRRPWLRGRGRVAARGRDAPGQHRAHQRRALLRRPRPPRGLDARVRRRPRGRRLRPGGRGDPAALDGGGRSLLPDGAEIVVYKNNSDGKGNSYGCHENYLMARAVPFGRIVTHDHAPLRHPPDLLRARARWAARRPASRAPRCRSSSRQRADFFEEEVGLETTLKRPIVNTRDEPHCDAQKYRRLHVIVGDANLRRGRHVPEGRHHRDRPVDDRGRRRADPTSRCRNPVGAIRQVSYDLTLRRAVLAGGRPPAHRAGGPVAAARAGPQVRARARAGERGRGGRGRGPPPLGGGPDRPRDGTRRPWPPASTGWPRSGSDEAYRERHGLEWGDARAAGDGHPVPRPARRSVALRPLGAGAALQRRRGRARP